LESVPPFWGGERVKRARPAGGFGSEEGIFGGWDKKKKAKQEPQKTTDLKRGITCRIWDKFGLVLGELTDPFHLLVEKGQYQEKRNPTMIRQKGRAINKGGREIGLIPYKYLCLSKGKK